MLSIESLHHSWDSIGKTQGGARVATSARGTANIDERPAHGARQPHDDFGRNAAMNMPGGVEVRQEFPYVGGQYPHVRNSCRGVFGAPWD